MVFLKEVFPYTIVGGNPAKIIKARFDQLTIIKLLKIKWWEWDIKKITRNLPLITSGNVDKLSRT